MPEMAEDEVQYTSVVFKNNRRPRAVKDEEVVYDEVKIGQTVQPQYDKKELTLDKEADTRGRQYQKLLFCFGSLCVILLLTIIGVSVYFVSLHKSDDQELKQLKVNQALLLEEINNLTNFNKKLNSDFNNQIYNLSNLNSNLKDQVNNLTNLSSEFKEQVKNLKEQKQNLIAELNQVKTKNQELQTNEKNLTDQIETMNKAWNEQNVSRAQWNMDQYCPKKDNVRTCNSCENGWEHNRSSCYAVNNAGPSNQKTWEEARENCKGKSSDLTVVGNQQEKTFVDGTSWTGPGLTGYWIGLRAVGGKWKWIDEMNLTNQVWLQHQAAAEGHCVTSLQNREWRSVSCNEKNAWICEKAALSV